MTRAVTVLSIVAAAFLVAPLSAWASPALPARPTPPAGGAAWADSLDRPAREGMVVSGHPEASKAGLAVLRRGGNAVDAAVAVAFALAAVSPDAGNLGGGGFLVLRRADGTATSWDFREQAPSGAWREMYAGPGAASSTLGHLAVGVPGTVAGLAAAPRGARDGAVGRPRGPGRGARRGPVPHGPQRGPAQPVPRRLRPLPPRPPRRSPSRTRRSTYRASALSSRTSRARSRASATGAPPGSTRAKRRT